MLCYSEHLCATVKYLRLRFEALNFEAEVSMIALCEFTSITQWYSHKRKLEKRLLFCLWFCLHPTVLHVSVLCISLRLCCTCNLPYLTDKFAGLLF